MQLALPWCNCARRWGPKAHVEQREEVAATPFTAMPVPTLTYAHTSYLPTMQTLELIQGIDTARVNNSLCRQGSGYPAYTPQQLSTPPGTDAASGLVFSRLTAANAGTVGLMPDWSGGGAAGGAAGGGGRDYDDDSESDSDGDGDEESDGEDGAAEGEEGGNAGVDPGTAPKRKRGRKPKRAAPKSAAVRNRVAVKAAAAAAAAACKATLGPSIRAFRPAFGEAAAALPAAASDADGSSGGGGGGEAEAWSVLDVAPLRLFSQVQAGLLALPPLPHSMLRAQRELQLVRKSTRKHRRAKSVDPLLSTLFHVQPALQCLQVGGSARGWEWVGETPGWGGSGCGTADTACSFVLLATRMPVSTGPFNSWLWNICLEPG